MRGEDLGRSSPEATEQPLIQALEEATGDASPRYGDNKDHENLKQYREFFFFVREKKGTITRAC